MSNQPAEMWSTHFLRELFDCPLKHWQRNSIAWLIGVAVVLSATTHCFSKTATAPAEPLATVTFYAKGSKLTTGLPGSKHGIFFGEIFDGAKPLVSFHEGLVIHNGRFITLQISPGPHDFVATDRKKPKDEQRISIDLKPGQEYFLRVQDESSGLVIVEWQKDRLDLTDCLIAHQEAGDARPLKPCHPSSELLAQRIQVEEMPPCQ